MALTSVPSTVPEKPNTMRTVAQVGAAFIVIGAIAVVCVMKFQFNLF